MDSFLHQIRSYDFAIYHYFYGAGLSSQLLSEFFTLFAKYGIVFFLFSFTYLIWMKRINAFLCSFMAMTIAALCDLMIFVFWQRPRPFITHDVVHPMTDALAVERFSSFPSSHTYIVFAIALSIYLYGHKRLGSVLLILAVMTAISRVGVGLHYPSDVIGGGLLGILSGVVAFRFVHQNEKYWQYGD